MGTVDDKIAAVTARWKELHSGKAGETPKMLMPRACIKKELPPPLPPPPVGTYGGRKENESFDSFWFRVFGILPEDFSSKKVTTPPGVNNDSEFLRSLKEPITWVGNIAVGADIKFAGWWNVVPPTGISISFVGEDAQHRAIGQAERLKDYYK